MNKYNKAIVIGGGAFGTAISNVLAENFNQVLIKVRKKNIFDDIKNGKNECYLPGLKLLKNLRPVMSWDEVFAGDDEKPDLLVFALPSAALLDYLKTNYEPLLTIFKTDVPVVSLVKGIDPNTLELTDEIYFHFFQEFLDNFTFLSGPSFAKEIIEKHITLVSLAGRSKQTLETISNMLDNSYFKTLSCYDIKGVLLGGALKNILAIAGGIIEGLGFNYNTRAAMITRGIAEMLRFGRVFNAMPETFYGLSGMGDLILSTTGDLSRNKLFGLSIAQGKNPQAVLEEMKTTVEGYKTTLAAHRLSLKYDIRASIFNGVYSVLYESINPLQALNQLMKTSTRFEFD